MEDIKPGEPGSVITFTEWVGGGRRERTGQVWSYGAGPATRWVIPDDSPAELVTVRFRKADRLHQVITTHPEGWQRRLIRACDNVLRADGLRAVIENADRRRGGYDPGDTLSWHANLDCPRVAGKPPALTLDGEQRTQRARDVVDRLLKGDSLPGSHFCGLCVLLLDEPVGAVA